MGVGLTSDTLPLPSFPRGLQRSVGRTKRIESVQGVRTDRVSGGNKTSTTIMAQTHAAQTHVAVDVVVVVGGRVDDLLLLGGSMLGFVIGG